MNIGAIIQARMGSTRLPGKILTKIADKPMLWHVIQRTAESSLMNKIIIATTTNSADDCIVDFANSFDILFFRGSEGDVLDRFYRTAKSFCIDAIVRITPDCPLIDPKIVDKVIKRFLIGNLDYISNVHPPTYPDGLDVEVFSFETLKKVWKEAKKASEREHVTPYILNHHRMFRISNIENEVDLSYMRWTVDEERDLKFVKEIYKRLYKNNKIFYMTNILNLLKKEPELSRINEGILRNEGYAKSLREE